MNDTDLGVYKAWDSLLFGIHEFTDLLKGAWNMFDATSTAAQPIGGAVIPDVCYTELFQRRYLFYGKAPPEHPAVFVKLYNVYSGCCDDHFLFCRTMPSDFYCQNLWIRVHCIHDSR